MLNRLKLIATSGAIALATGASAQISNIQTSTDASLKIDGATVTLTDPVTSPFYQSAPVGGAGYSTSAVTTGESIFFQAGSMSAGSENRATSFVELSFDVTNNSSSAITQAVSTVFESNFGMYIANFNRFPVGGGGDVKAPCTGANLANCLPINQGPGFANIRPLEDSQAPFTLAYTKFLFEIVQDGNTLKTIGGTLQLDRLANDSLVFQTGGGFADLATSLNGFAQFEGFEDRVWAFSWEDTDVAVDLAPILVGSTSTLTYRISTESWTDSNFQGNVRNTIVAFSCFADPVGRGSTRASMFTVPGFGPSTCNDYRAGTPSEPSPYALKVPVLRDGKLIFTSTGAPPIPEPDTWAMLIVGFGLIGLSMRRGKPAETTVA